MVGCQFGVKICENLFEFFLRNILSVRQIAVPLQPQKGKRPWPTLRRSRPLKKVFKKMLENLHSSKNGRNFASLLAQKQNGSESKTETAASERREIIEIFAKRKILTNANALEKQGNKGPSLSSRFRMTG